MQIENKIAIVTGASSGLGAAIATGLVNKKAQVYGIARNKEKLLVMQNQLGELFHPVALDITHQNDITTWVQNTFTENFIPDILINNAGIGQFGKIDEMPSEQWTNMINTNLNGMYFITAAVVPLLKKKHSSSHIINIGSILGTTGKEDAVAYSTTKFGVQGFSDSLFKELRSHNIKVTCFNPGSIETNFFKNSGIEAHDNMLHPEDLTATIIHVLETPDNMLINEIVVRPLNPKQPKKLHSL